jgi:beta-galactosidase
MKRERWNRFGLAPVALFFVGLLTAGAAENPANSNGRQVLPFNQDWMFSKGDIAGAQAIDFDDSAWAAVRLPHDWAIAGPFDASEDGFAGKLPWRGVGWYRRTFTLDHVAASLRDADASLGEPRPRVGRRVYLDFDGVMAFPQVYVNGQLAGGWDYGYNSFRVDATPYVKFGEPNVVAVRVDTRRHGTRWYPGAGIYRKVALTICDPVHIAHWGTFVTTPKVSDEAATVQIRSTIENHRDSAADVRVDVVLTDPQGKEVGSSTSSHSVPAGGSREFDQSLKVAKPQRWDIASPNLYSAHSKVTVGDELVDSETTPLGIRTFEFTAADGFHLNGRRVQLYGVNLHHDQGPLGGAFYTRAMERQLEIMQDMGVNAIRTSHNPPAPELLDLCDRMGLVVWDECFDKWNETADRISGEPPLEEFGEKQIRNFVMRDRNHPSIVVWSIANEIPNQPGDREGMSPERVKFMSEFVLKYDPTRPVGLACHIPETAYTKILDAADLVGWNYARRYALFRERYPKVPIIYSESASAISTRGFYELPLPNSRTTYSSKHQVDSYDWNSAQWSDIADVEFALMERDPFVAGEFVWTGFDYLGEPTPFSREARSSYFGIVDLCGIPKDRFYLYRSHWRPDTTTVHILPHWNWPERVGKNVPVFVYTNGDSAELFLNDRSLGRREKIDQYTPASNLAEGKPALASSERRDQRNEAARATDGNEGTLWSAEGDAENPWLQVDLEKIQPIERIDVVFERSTRDYQYKLKISDDGANWKTVVVAEDWGDWGNRVSYEVDAQTRFARIEFTNLRDRAQAGVRELGVYADSYYSVTDKYRLRWMDVVYEPGELKAVAYKDGKQIGEAVMRTAGPPATIRLTPDRESLEATGDDLCYVLVEALDENGTLCPLANNLIQFQVEGPAEIAAVGNGNPLSIAPFQADHRKLFYGKAMLILRTKDGESGPIQITGESDGLRPASLTVGSHSAD